MADDDLIEPPGIGDQRRVAPVQSEEKPPTGEYRRLGVLPAPEVRRLGRIDQSGDSGGGLFERYWNGLLQGKSLFGGETPLAASTRMSQDQEKRFPITPEMGYGDRLQQLRGRLHASGPLDNPMAGAFGVAPMNAMGGAMGALRGGIQRETGAAAADAIAPESSSSTIATAIANGNPSAIDRAMTSAYKRAVRPGRSGIQNAPQMDEQDRRIVTAIDQIIGNRPSLQLTDPRTGQSTTGQLPQSLRQFSEALDQTKRDIFRQYSDMAQRSGDMGVQVDMSPAIQELRELAMRPEVADLHPNVVSQATQVANNIERRGAYSPEAAQDMIENINQTIKGTFNNPSHETYSYNTLLAKVATTIRDQLDKAITETSGPGYQELRNRYGALRSVEKDVSTAAQREAIKSGTIPHNLADIWSGEEIMRGLLTLNPTAVARGGAIQLTRRLLDWVNSPNRAIQRLFQRRQAMMSPMPTPDYRMGMVQAPTQIGMQRGAYTREDKPRDPRPSVGGP